MPGELAVHIHVRDLKDAFEVQIIPVFLVLLGNDLSVFDDEIHVRDMDFLPIPAVAGIETVREKIRQTERVRDMGEFPLAVVEVDRLPVLDRSELEFPFGVEVGNHPAGKRRLLARRNKRHIRTDGLRVRLSGAEDHDSGAEDRADPMTMKHFHITESFSVFSGRHQAPPGNVMIHVSHVTIFA